jgi:hypothetical protein
MRDMHAFRTELARQRLRQAAQRELGGREGGETGAAAQARGGAGKDDRSALARRHMRKHRSR